MFIPEDMQRAPQLLTVVLYYTAEPPFKIHLRIKSEVVPGHTRKA